MIQVDTNAPNFVPADNYVRGFFMYVDPDHQAIEMIYGIAVARTLKAISEGWRMPDGTELLKINVEHMEDMFRREEQGSPQTMVDHEAQIASFPDVYFRIREVLDSDTSSADDIAEVVSTDIGLSAKLLKLVNSPLYGFSTPIDSVARAVSLIGIKELSTLALGISTINFFKDIPPELIDMKVFWRHSISCAIFSKLLASKVKGVQAERLFTAGLLHDVGRLILFKKLPYASVQALLYARENMVPLVDAETEIFGYNHTDVASVLMSSWNFPKEMTDVVSGHHSPMQAGSPVEAAIVQVADNLANAVDISTGGKFVLSGISEGAWETLKLDPELLEPIVNLYDQHIGEIFDAFL